jgi:hypothetical protein
MLTGIEMQDTINLIKGGYRHAQPEGCPDVVYHVVLRCWSEDPNDRSTFGKHIYVKRDNRMFAY